MEANQSAERRVRWTYAEFARLPESGSTRYEIIDDQLVATPAPGRAHQRIDTDLVTLRDRGVKLDRYRLFEVAEYWIVDPAARTIEAWDLAGGAEEARVHGPGDSLRWAPVADAPALEIDVGELLG